MEIQLADIRQFAAATAGFDLIIAGGISSGMLFQATDSRGEKVTIVSPGEHAASVADVRFLLQETASGFTLETVTASIIPMEGISYRDAAIAGYEAISDEIEQYISRELGSISQTISAGFSYLGDSAFMDLIHQLQLDLTGADISFAAPSAMDARIEQGVVTVQDLFRLFPFETQLYVLELTGREIDAYLEYSYARWITAMQDTDTLAAEIAACDSAAGIVYTVDPNGMEGERVAVTGVLSPYEYGSEPKPFNPDGTYLVVVPSFRGQGGGGHLTEGAGLEREELQERIQYATLQDVRLYAMRLFEYSGTYQPFCDENWTFLP